MRAVAAVALLAAGCSWLTITGPDPEWAKTPHKAPVCDERPEAPFIIDSLLGLGTLSGAIGAAETVREGTGTALLVAGSGVLAASLYALSAVAGWADGRECTAARLEYKAGLERERLQIELRDRELDRAQRQEESKARARAAKAVRQNSGAAAGSASADDWP